MGGSLARSDPLDFYLWDLIESQMHPTFPKSLPDLKKAILWVTHGMTFETCAKVIVEVGLEAHKYPGWRRTNIGILRNGGHTSTCCE